MVNMGVQGKLIRVPIQALPCSRWASPWTLSVLPVQNKEDDGTCPEGCCED